MNYALFALVRKNECSSLGGMKNCYLLADSELTQFYYLLISQLEFVVI